MDLSGYALATLHQDGEFALCRGRAVASATPHPSSVLVSIPAAEHPVPARVRLLEHELALRDDLDSTWALRPLVLAQHQGRSVLILEDQQGEPLARFLEKSPVSRALRGRGSAEPAMELGLFLRLAVGLARALGEVHRRGIIHKNVKPAHVLVNTTTGQVWLTGFGIASRLPRERQAPEPPDIIAGTLAYMAPEQTGRMNRSIDCRSDLYALGVTLYQMLTGSLPFTAAEPIEWVHCHIARQPIAPGERVANAPAPVSAIIMKLLAKTAEERYQTGAGLERDLRHCLIQWEAERRIDDFPLGEHDTPDRLLIPEKLYGRAREIETLLAAFDRVVRSGAPELVLVSGYSGIGKSSVVNELHKALVPPRGQFASGKFDQLKRDVPYATLAQAFQSLIRQLLGKPEAELREWRDQLRRALDPNGALLLDLIPELKFIIGEQLAVPEVPPADAKVRFQTALRALMGVFARAAHPLALFLDDLQWLDGATLELLENIFVQPEPQHLLLVSAYRDNEVGAAHPLTRTLSAIRESGAVVHEIVLQPLARDDLTQWCADALHSQSERTLPLARLVHEKTGGNPFFANQFLAVLADERLLTFDPDAARWSWDLARIHAKGYTDNVVELMVGKLGRLPARTQRALQELACLGNSADLARLAMVHEGSEEELRQDLQEAHRAEFVVHADGSCRFLHDRVQEAAYFLIPETQRAAAHLRIGRLLVAHTPAERREEAIFEIVNQLNRGAELIVSRDEKEQLAELNLTAGKRAKGSAAYVSALNYFVSGTTLLPDDGWERRPDLMFALESHRAECEFLTGELAAAESRLTTLASRAVNPVDRATVACLRIDVFTALDRSDRALEVCLDYLRGMGIERSPRGTADEARRAYQRLLDRLGDHSIEELVELPRMTDPGWLGAMDVLTAVVPAAAFTDEDLFRTLVLDMTSISLEHGNCDGSSFGYVCLHMVLGQRFGDYESAYRFAKLGFDLGERGLGRFAPRIYMGFALAIPWTRPMDAANEIYRRARRVALDTGDPAFACYTQFNLAIALLAGGHPLDEVQAEAELGSTVALQVNAGMAADLNACVVGMVRALRGLTPDLVVLDETAERHAERERRLDAEPGLFIARRAHLIRKLQACTLAGDPQTALAAAQQAEGPLWPTAAWSEHVEYAFYAALAGAAAGDGPGRAALARHRERLGELAAISTENLGSRMALVDAEVARLDGRELDAERLYERASRLARERGFVQIEALANELAARFYAGRGFERIAKAYLRDARDGYRQWGADGKVRQLEAQYPNLGDEPPAADPTRTVLAPVEHLDLSTVLQVSQAVQGETDLEKLIAAIMRLGLEHAGAGRGLLILPHADGHRIEAEAQSSNAKVTVDLRQTSIDGDDLPQSILQYVLRTRERVVLQDAAAASEFADDGYLRRQRARSVLCIPLLKQTRLAGILYLENNLTSGVFTPARMALLEVLASDAAISLENARLYREISALKDQLYKENLVLRDEVDRTSMFEEIVGTSPALRPVLTRVAKVARTDSTVLLTGETGTGKELVARAIHRRSARTARAFVSVNCAAVPRELIASELFGHEKGAFTGATQRRLGRFELAHGGTIFLDEVGDLPMETQVALLRVLQEREFERVGGSTSIRVDLRVVAATNRDLQAAIEVGAFRSDLFYRLNVFPIAVPALRERTDDIPLLVEYFIDRYARKAGKTIRRVNKRTLDHLRSYPWPGNVRELQNVIERSVIVCDTDEFTVDESWVSARPTIEGPLALSGSLATHEKAIIEDALRASGGRVFGPSGAAARLGIPRSTLESKIRVLKINKSRFRVRPAKG